jgi:hypothetical protein
MKNFSEKLDIKSIGGNYHYLSEGQQLKNMRPII